MKRLLRDCNTRSGAFSTTRRFVVSSRNALCFRLIGASDVHYEQNNNINNNFSSTPLVCCKRQVHRFDTGVIQPEEVSFVVEISAKGSAAASVPINDTTEDDGTNEGTTHDINRLLCLPAVKAASSSALPESFTDVRKLDKFARARVVNFLRKYATERRGSENTADILDTEEMSDSFSSGERSGHSDIDSGACNTNEKLDSDGLTFFYHCRIYLPITHPVWPGSARGLWAHGVGPTRVEAELLATMHAERIIDELGYHIYTLPSMQRKHAAAAAKAGRRAPSPDAISSGASLNLADFPLPLRRLGSNRDETEGQQWQLLDITGTPPYMAPPLALLSPAVFDSAALWRVRECLKDSGFTLTDLCLVEGERRASNNSNDGCGSSSSSGVAEAAGEDEDCDGYVTVSITLPHELFHPSSAAPGDDTMKVVAQGKALTRETAMALAGMHAELLLDTLHTPLFPNDAAKQKAHALAAWRCGRAAPLPGAPQRDPSHVVLPLPIKELDTTSRHATVAANGSNSSSSSSARSNKYALPRTAAERARTTRLAPRNAEEDYVWRHQLITAQCTDFSSTDVAEDSALSDLTSYLASVRAPRAQDPFFHESIQGCIKATVVLPVPDACGIRGGVGVATTVREADLLAASHALNVLTALGIPVKATSEAQEKWEHARADAFGTGSGKIARIGYADASPPGLRVAGKTLARHVDVAQMLMESSAVSFPGSSSASSTLPHEQEKQEGVTTAETAETPKKKRRVPKRAKLASELGQETKKTAIREEERTKEESSAPPESETRYLECRKWISKECWSIEADSPDGYIMLAPKDEQEANIISPAASSALYSPRMMDRHSKQRVKAYLASMGRRFEDIFVTHYIDSDENGGVGIHTCAASLPVPSRFGNRVALGSAATASEAEHLAAMHAELILDTLGIGLFIDPKRQQQHAEECWSRGRWAPPGFSSGGGGGDYTVREEYFKPADTPNPPPLRREYVGSVLWEKHKQQKQKRKALLAPRSVRRARFAQEASEVESSSAVVESRNAKENLEIERLAAVVDGTGSAAMEEIEPTTSRTPTPKETHTPVLEAELDFLSKMRVQYYLRRHGKHIVSPQYTVTLSKGTVQHTASWQLPVPASTLEQLKKKEREEVGGVENNSESNTNEVLVTGIATVKRDAELLAWMHAERTLDALEVPIFDNLPGLQAWHAVRVDKQGRWAPGGQQPRPNSPSSSPTLHALPPPPLKLVPTPTKELERPLNLRMQDSEGGDSFTLESWEAYCERCSSYIAAKEMAARDVFFDNERAPRTGNALYDAALDEAETTSATNITTTDNNSSSSVSGAGTKKSDTKWLLQSYCHAAGTVYPQHWRVQTVGPVLHRVQLTTIAIPGHEYVLAQGVGSNKDTSHRRAAAHALAMLKRLDPNYDMHMNTALEGSRSSSGRNVSVAEDTDGGDALDGADDDDTITFSADSLLMSSLMASAKALDSSLPMMKGRSSRHSRVSKSSRKKFNKIKVPAWNARLNDFSHEGKVLVIELFAVCFQLSPPKVEHTVSLTRDADDSGNGFTIPLRTSTVTIEDENGVSWSGKASGGGPVQNELHAYEHLFAILSTHVSSFEMMKNMVRKDAYINPRKIPTLQLTQEQRERMQSCVERTSPPADAEDGGGEKASQALTTRQFEKFMRMELAQDAAATAPLVSMMDASQQQQESRALMEALRSKITNVEYLEKFARRRDGLHIAARKDAILGLLRDHPIVIVSGTTGCGKTTQVPQYILDYETERGSGGTCSILVTQPRRLSTVSIAQRVAAERLESVGDSCGYTIRFDSRPGRHINFCTTGILLRILRSSPLLEGINYIIIDEIHERDMNSDFLLMLLRDLMRKRKDLHVILMSATLEVEVFSSFFANAPVVNVNGYAYPVQEMFIEDLVPHARAHKFVSPLLDEVASSIAKGTLGTFSAAAAAADDDRSSSTAMSLSRDTSTKKYGVLETTTGIDYPAVQFAVEQAMRMADLKDSSILVFLPGWDEIVRAKLILERNPVYHIISLHSSVGSEEQMECFFPAPEGKIKLILSTNIAESGVTIDDVGAVIDVGRAKEKCYMMREGRTRMSKTETRSVSRLISVYASRANCVQRRGRAGRTRPGICIRLYTRHHFETLHQFQTPEILRLPLDEVCLQIMCLCLCDPLIFFQGALEPPPADHVEAAMARLQDLGAVTKDHQLTALGLRLSQLPVNPRAGKLILLGAIFGCLDTTLTAASVRQTDVFATDRLARDATRLHKEDLSCDTQSDILGSVNGFNYWVTSHCQKGPAEVGADLQARQLSVPNLLLVSRLKKQFFKILHESGFLAVETAAAASEVSQDVFVDLSAHSVDAYNVGLVKSLIACSMFPNIAMATGTRTARTKFENKVRIAADSVYCKTLESKLKMPFLVYDEAAHVSYDEAQMFLTIRTLSSTPLWAIVLFGTNYLPIVYNYEVNLACIDGWIWFQTSPKDVRLIERFKEALNVRLARKFLDPADAENNVALEAMVTIVKELVNTPLKTNQLCEEVWAEEGSILEAKVMKEAVEDVKEQGGD